MRSKTVRDCYLSLVISSRRFTVVFALACPGLRCLLDTGGEGLRPLWRPLSPWSLLVCWGRVSCFLPLDRLLAMLPLYFVRVTVVIIVFVSFSYVSWSLGQLRRSWPISRQAPHACAFLGIPVPLRLGVLGVRWPSFNTHVREL